MRGGLITKSAPALSRPTDVRRAPSLTPPRTRPPLPLLLLLLREAVALAPLFGLLVERAARDLAWLDATLVTAAARDPFTARVLALAHAAEVPSDIHRSIDRAARSRERFACVRACGASKHLVSRSIDRLLCALARTSRVCVSAARRRLLASLYTIHSARARNCFFVSHTTAARCAPLSKAARKPGAPEPLTLGIHRSDYMLQQGGGADDDSSRTPLRQVRRPPSAAIDAGARLLCVCGIERRDAREHGGLWFQPAASQRRLKEPLADERSLSAKAERSRDIPRSYSEHSVVANPFAVRRTTQRKRRRPKKEANVVGPLLSNGRSK